MNFIKEKGMFIVLLAVIFGLTAFGAWSSNKLDEISVEVDHEYVYANLR